MKYPIQDGLLIAIEGIDGAGKTSVATALAQWCGERGIACCMSKEPTGVSFGKTLRESAQSGRGTIDDELDMFILDRRDHVARTIAPALAKNAIVILDRYYWSTAAYQGARGADIQQILARNHEFAPKPDLTIVLDVPVSIGRQRISTRGDIPNEFEDKKGLEKAREIFKQLAESDPATSRLIDATRSMREVGSDALAAFKHFAVAKIAANGKLRHGGIVTPQELNEVLEFFGQPPIQGETDLVAV
jgi:dTMP kinase